MKVLYKKEKGVSPVIATILMVAITVVLASAVYLIVSGYFTSAPSKPVAIGVVPSTNATATKFLITSGNISISSGTPLTITVTVSGGATYTISLPSDIAPVAKFPGTAYITGKSSSSLINATLYLSHSAKTYLTGGDFITISYNGGPLPAGSTVTWTYNNNAIYTYTA